MKKLILGIAALPMFAVAAPAAAQYFPNNANQYPQYANQHTNQGNLSVRIQQLSVRLQAGVQNRSITRREAAPIREQIRQLGWLQRQYAAGGITGHEMADLQQRIRTVRKQLRLADGGANGRYAQWDAEDGYGQGYRQYPQGYGQGYQQPYPQAYDQSYQQPYPQAYGQGYQQPYPQAYGQGYQQPGQQGGIVGMVTQMLGIGGLQVGQRATANLYGVPYAYQGQYRDGNGVYYRSDGQRIYQIDARSQTVIRIFSM